MKVKKYIVQSMPEAMELIRAELGSEAMILTTKPVVVGGMFGLFQKQRIEVVAGVDSREQNKLYRDPGRNERAKTSMPNIQTNMGRNTEVSGSEQVDGEVLQQLTEMKKMMQQFTRQNQSAKKDPEVIEIWTDHLLDQGVDRAFVEEARVHVMDTVEDPNSLTDEEVEKLLLHYWCHRFSMIEESDGWNGRVIQFVGPTGVGKTTTMAKIAARQVLKHGKKVGFIAADTYRIAAVEQLRTYASILDVPFKVVHSAHDFREALQQFTDLDFIFMDTAGRNYQNPLHVSELNSLIAEVKDRDVVLVLSLTTHYKDIKMIIENFLPYKIDQILLTKADETMRYGSIVNLLEEFKLPIRYIANGQNVPEDLRKFQVKEWIVRLLEAKERA